MRKKTVDRRFAVTGFFSSFDFDWSPEFVFRGESHEMWEIVFIKGGKVEVTEDESVYMLERDNMILHAPWEFHRIRSAQRTSPSGHIISFYTEGELPERLREGIFVLSTEQRLRYSEICDRIKGFLRSDSPSPYTGQEIASSLECFLIELSGEAVSVHADTGASATEYRKLVVAMSQSVCDNKTLSDFAAECADSVSYIKQLFYKNAGISPKSYYNNLRVRHAAGLLDEGISVGEIAERMNFSSSNYFSAFFKKHTGVSPLDYKRKA